MTTRMAAFGRFARRAVAAHSRRHEDGITLAIFALALVVLLGMVALGIDGSRIYDERRRAQNAADHAAIAAAYASCASTSTDAATLRAAAEAAGYDSADANGFDDNPPINDVFIDVATGADEFDHEYRADIDTTISTTFGAVIGFSELNTNATATARATGCDAAAGGSGPGAIFGGGTCPSSGKYSVDVSGSSNQVYGGVHGNDEVSVGGSSNIFYQAGDPDDPFTYVTSITGTAGDTFQPGYPLKVASRAWPAGFEPSVITGGTGVPAVGTFLRPYYDLAVANLTFSTGKITSITKDGVYYTTNSDGFDVGSVSGSVRNVVLVAPNGPIKISDSSTTFNAYNHASLPKTGILMLSNKIYTGDEACDKFVVAVSGSSVTWNGILWGPRGLIEMSGSTNTAVNGALIGHAVRLNGSNITINYDSSLFAGAEDPDVFLVH